jgi:hypothetical protein
MLYSEAAKKMIRYSNKLKSLYPSVKIEYIILQGNFSESVIEYAVQHNTDLIIVGVTSNNVVARTILGNHTLTIIRNAPCMVIAVPHKTNYHTINKIVYATDLTADNLEHAGILVSLAESVKAELILLYVSLILKDKRIYNMNDIVKEAKRNLHYEKISGYICDELDVRAGISYFLSRHKADCLAIYSSQHGIIESLFRKSIVKKLSRKINLPMLVIHEKDLMKRSSRKPKKREKLRPVKRLL